MEWRVRFPEEGNKEIDHCRDAIHWGNGTRSGWIDELVVWREITELVDEAFGSDEEALSLHARDRIAERLKLDKEELLDRAKYWSDKLFDQVQDIMSENDRHELVLKLIELERTAKAEADAAEYQLGLAVLRSNVHDFLVRAAEEIEDEEFSEFTIPQLVAFIREHGGVNQEGRRDGIIVNEYEASAWVSLHTLDDDWRGIIVDLETGLTEAGERVFEI